MRQRSLLFSVLLLAGCGGAGTRGTNDGKEFALVRVFYGTDREPTGAKEPERFYGTTRGALAVGTVDVSIPRDHRMGEMERPSILRLEFSEDPSKHVMLRAITPMEGEPFGNALRERSKDKELFVFVHGYNNSFAECARRTAQLAYDLGFAGAAAMFSWPSKESVFGYSADEASVERAVPHLVVYLNLLRAFSGAKVFHLVAHSMGNRVLVRAVNEIAATRPDGERPCFNQIVLAAPDIDTEVFRQLSARVRKVSERVTLYASSNDFALDKSKLIHDFPRLGLSGDDIAIVAGVDTIDASDVDTSFMGHSYFAENSSVLSDLLELFKNRQPPTKRPRLKESKKGAGVFWKVAGQ